LLPEHVLLYLHITVIDGPEFEIRVRRTRRERGAYRYQRRKEVIGMMNI
jgi:hypothetical protein